MASLATGSGDGGCDGAASGCGEASGAGGSGLASGCAAAGGGAGRAEAEGRTASATAGAGACAARASFWTAGALLRFWGVCIERDGGKAGSGACAGANEGAPTCTMTSAPSGAGALAASGAGSGLPPTCSQSRISWRVCGCQMFAREAQAGTLPSSDSANSQHGHSDECRMVPAGPASVGSWETSNARESCLTMALLGSGKDCDLVATAPAGRPSTGPGV